MSEKGAWVVVIVGVLLLAALAKCPQHQNDHNTIPAVIDGGEKPPEPPKPIPCRWEYKVQYSLPSPRPDRKGEKALLPSSITPAQEDLARLGAESWELATTYLEPETAFPQMPDKSTVANTRPQRLVMLFKRRTPLGCWK